MKVKAVGFLAGVASLALVFAAGDILAQGRGSGGKGPNYNVATETTVTGTVQDLKAGPQQGTHVMLKTADATLELALGPLWYQTEKKYEIAKGDQLTVMGAKSTVDGHDLLLVREIKKGSETMTFRDANGFPKWAGRGRQ